MGDAAHVDAAGDDVRGHQHVEASGPEALHRPIALGLGHVALQADGAVARLLELQRQTLGPVLGPREDDGRLAVAPVQHVLQQVAFAVLGHRHEGMVDGARRLGVRQLHHTGLVEHLVGEAADLLGHGGREEHVLTLCGQDREDLADVDHEAHVEHVIGLVEHEGLHAPQVQHALLYQVEHAAGTAHDDLRPATQLVGLHALGDSAEDGNRPDPGVAGEGADLGVDLRGEFACGREHQDAGTATGLAHEPVQDGQGEGRRLARAGMSQTQHVVAEQAVGDGPHLDGAGVGEAGGVDAAQQGVVKAEAVEAVRLAGMVLSHEFLIRRTRRFHRASGCGVLTRTTVGAREVFRSARPRPEGGRSCCSPAGLASGRGGNLGPERGIRKLESRAAPLRVLSIHSSGLPDRQLGPPGATRQEAKKDIN